MANRLQTELQSTSIHCCVVISFETLCYNAGIFGVFNPALFQGHSALIGQFTLQSVKTKPDWTLCFFYLLQYSYHSLIASNALMLFYKITLTKMWPCSPRISFMYPHSYLSHSFDKDLTRGGMEASENNVLHVFHE